MTAITGIPGLDTRIDRAAFYAGDYHATFAALRRADPFHWQPETEMWLITRHADIRQIASDTRRFSNNYGVTVGSHAIARAIAGSGEDPARSWRLAEVRREIGRRSSAAPDVDNLQSLDPPAHAALRKALAGSFTPRVISRIEDRVRELTRLTLEEVNPGEVADFMDIIAVPVPIYVIAELLGVDKQDRDAFRRWSDVVIGAVEPKSEHERAKDADQFAEMFSYFREQAELRRRAPREDLLTLLVQAQVGGDRLGSALVETLAKLILSAGNETTRSGIAGSALALARHPDQRQVLLDSPELIEGAVNEFLRWTTPVRAFCRTATEDMQYGDRPIRRGDFVALSYVSANRDERAWPDPERFDVRREISPMHLSFGHGPHVCLGQTLARIEIKVVVEELLAHFPAFELAGEPIEIASTMVHGYDALPMRLA